MKLFYQLAIILTLWANVQAIAQEVVIYGTIKDTNGTPLLGVNVSVKGTTRGSSTDGNGAYRIEGLEAGKYTLVASIVSYQIKPKKVILANRQQLRVDFAAEEKAQELDGVTVAGEKPSFSPKEITGATKLPVSYNDLPLSATVIQSELITSRQFTRPETALRMVSGLTPVASPHSQTKADFLARGFFLNSSLGGVLKDGKYYAGTDSPIADVSSIERVEFLKGASSLLYGSAEPGGQLNYVYKQPLAEAAYEANLLYGSWNTFRATLDAGGPIIEDKLLYRATLGVEDSETWQDFSYTERYAPMVSLLYNIGPATTLQLTGEMIIQDANPSNTDAPVVNMLNQDGSGRARFFRTADNWYGGFTNDFSEDLTQVYQASLRHEFSESFNISANFSWNKSERESAAAGYFPFAGPNNTQGLGEPDPETGDLNRLVFAQGRFVNGIASNIDVNYQFNTGVLNHNIVAGASYTRINTQNRNGFSPLVPPGFINNMPPTNIFEPVYVPFEHLRNTNDSPPFAITDWNEDEVGVYVQNLVSIEGTGLKAMLGLRFNNYTYETSSATLWNGIDGPGFPDRDNRFLVPRLGLIYEFAPAFSAYASFSKSIVPIAPIAVDGNTLDDSPDPILGEQFEVGFKGTFFEKLNYTLSLYQLDRENIVVPLSPQLSVQDGVRRSRGIEFDINGSLARGHNLYLSYGYTDTEVVESGINELLEGQRLSGVPEHFFSVWNTYEFKNRFGFGIGAEHRSDWIIQAGTSLLTVPLEEDGYFVANASLFYTLPVRNSEMHFNFTANNIFDEYYFLPTENTVFVKRGAPVGYTFSVNYAFGR